MGDQSIVGYRLNVMVPVDNGPELIVECWPDQALPGAETAVRITWARDRAIVLESEFGPLDRVLSRGFSPYCSRNDTGRNPTGISIS